MPTFTVFKGSKDGVPKKSTTTKPDELVGDNVLIKITASGLCGTDMHCLSKDMVLGHEGVGVVEALGPNVQHLKRGDRVGWGFAMDSCGHCRECLKGEEVYCPERALYSLSNLDQGSFASHAIWREAFLHAIPDVMTDETAAPLQCGGATVYTALQDAKSSETIGIMGMGGLGHLAIQFAAKMGTRVVMISGSDSKKDEAAHLGAHDFVAMKGKSAEDLAGLRKLDRLLVTTSVPPDWELVLPMMAPKSRIYPLSVSEGKLEIPCMLLIFGGISINGSLVANRSVHNEMLDFAAFHKIKPITETFPMTEEGIEEAIDRLKSGKIHFRAVLIPQ